MENIENKSERIHHTCSKHYADRAFTELNIAGKRGSELADQFTNLEVQIATILFAFAGFFLDSFVNKLNSNGELASTFSQGGILMMKITFALIVFFLIASLTFGLIHIKRKEKFWDGIFSQKNPRLIEWEKALIGGREEDYRNAKTFHDGTALGKVNGINVSPTWTWVLQTIFLGLAIIPMFILFLVFLFH
jgi:hypothetical protein